MNPFDPRLELFFLVLTVIAKFTLAWLWGLYTAHFALAALYDWIEYKTGDRPDKVSEQ